jgi:hypothetical protein
MAAHHAIALLQAALAARLADAPALAALQLAAQLKQRTAAGKARQVERRRLGRPTD